MQLVLSTQQWLGGILTAVVALFVYAAGVRSSRASQRYEQLNNASVRLSEAAVRLASAVSATEHAEPNTPDEADATPPAVKEKQDDTVARLRTLHEQVRAAATAVSLSTRSRQVRLLNAVIVRTSWQMRHHASHPDEPPERLPWWRFEVEHPHPAARRCPACPIGVRPPVAIMSEATRHARTVRRMNKLIDEFQFAVATEVTRSPYSLGQGGRRLLAWALDWSPRDRPERPARTPPPRALRAWWEQLPDLLRQRGVPRREELDQWLHHYGFVAIDDPKPDRLIQP